MYYDGKTSTRHRVTISLAANGVTIQKEEGHSVFWPFAEIRQAEDQYGGSAIRFERGHSLPESVVIEDPSFLSVFKTLVRGEYRQFRFPLPMSRRISLLLSATLFSLATIVSLVLWGIPLLADVLSPFVPVSWEVALGKAAVAQLAPQAVQCSNAKLREETGAILSRIVTAAPSSYEFHLTIVDNNTFNAFALPGGEIVVYRPLLEATQEPNELAGVLAHEVQHVLLRHTTRSLLRELSLAMLVGALFGDISGITAFAVQAARTFSTLHYNRGMEEEADLQGFRLLKLAHFDPNGMIRFFETMKTQIDQPQIPAYLSTHPDTETRISKLKSLVHPAQELSNAPADDSWTETKHLCR